jgi:hypothetical protein
VRGAAAKFSEPGRLSAPPPIYLGERSRRGKVIMRRWTILLVVLAIAGFAASASAQGKIRLAQTSVTTTCMMTCNSQYANCQSSCLATGTQAQSTAPGTIFGAQCESIMPLELHKHTATVSDNLRTLVAVAVSAQPSYCGRCSMPATFRRTRRDE